MGFAGQILQQRLERTRDAKRKLILKAYSLKTQLEEAERKIQKSKKIISKLIKYPSFIEKELCVLEVLGKDLEEAKEFLKEE